MRGDPYDRQPDMDPQGPGGLQDIWQAQKMELDPVTLAHIHAKSVAFEKTINGRNAREYVACGLTLAVFILIAIFLSPNWLMKAGSACIVLATLFVAWQLHSRFSASAMPQIGETLAEAYRRQLVRQRDGALTVGQWYLLPMTPGLVLLEAGVWLRGPAHGVPVERFRAGFIITAAAMVLVFGGVWLLNLRGARRLQKAIDAL
jgi:hypothetical protein